jgi:glutathione synthase/RimK-type ligase-like ATP-grasp enzyme
MPPTSEQVMKKCAILSMDDTTGFEVYDHLIEPFLHQTGWQTETIPWKRPNVDWNQYDLVIIRSTWDYQDFSDQFLAVLAQIENSTARLDNPLSIVRWNIDKRYLAELEQKGVEIVPTLWREQLTETELEGYFEQLNSKQLVIKPCISACAFDTFWFNQDNINQFKSEMLTTFKQRNFMVQPFMPSVIEEGEFSVFYFDGKYSHCILKTPKANDFRVQEEHGGRLLKVEPEPQLLKIADKALAAIDTDMLYARLDFVRSDTGFAMMEAELIEPSLYFNIDHDAAERFVERLNNRMQRLGLGD